MDSAKVIALHAPNQRAVMSLGYHDETVEPGLPVIAIPTTAGTGAETNTYGVITDESVGRKGYVGHESVLPRLAILDPELTLGPAARADRRDRRRRADALARVAPLEEPEPARRGDRPRDGPDRRRPGCPVAVADGSNLEARSRMLLAAHYAGVGQQTGTGVGAVHAIGHAIGTRGRIAHGTALATVMPEVFETYLGVRDRELALVAVALGVAAPARSESPRPPEPPSRPSRDLLDRVGQRRTLAAAGPRARTPTRRSPRTPSTTRRSTTARDSPRSPRSSRSSLRSGEAAMLAIDHVILAVRTWRWRRPRSRRATAWHPSKAAAIRRGARRTGSCRSATRISSRRGRRSGDCVSERLRQWIAGANPGRPLGWAVRTDSIEAVGQRLDQPVVPGSRAQPDGALDHLAQRRPRHRRIREPGLPFFIQWGDGVPLPGATAVDHRAARRG